MDTYDPPAFLAEAIATAPVALSLTAASDGEASRPLVSANARFWALTGFEAQHMLGRDPRCLQAGTVQPRGRERLRKALAASEPVEAVLRNRHRGGAEYDMFMSIVPLPGREGTPLFFLCAHLSMPREGDGMGWAGHRARVAESFERVGCAWRGHIGGDAPLDPFLRDDPWRCATARLAGFDVAVVRH